MHARSSLICRGQRSSSSCERGCSLATRAACCALVNICANDEEGAGRRLLVTRAARAELPAHARLGFAQVARDRFGLGAVVDVAAAHRARGRAERGRVKAARAEPVTTCGRDDRQHDLGVAVVGRARLRERREAHRALALLGCTRALRKDLVVRRVRGRRFVIVVVHGHEDAARGRVRRPELFHLDCRVRPRVDGGGVTERKLQLHKAG